MDARQFLAEFQHIVSAPGGIQRIRQMIYNLAITGNLTSQIPEDGTAKALLQDIDQTKQRLIKEKNFKRSPKLESYPNSVPDGIRIPNSWCWSRLVDIGEINPRNKSEDSRLASFLPMSGVPQRHSDPLQPENYLWRQIKRGYTHFADGDVAVAKITPSFENGKAAVIQGLTNGIGAGSTELHVVRPLSQFVDPNYIYIFLRSPYFAIVGENYMTGTAGQKRLPTEYFATRPFPLPPTAEQRRIVAKVNELMTLCDKLEAQQQEHDELSNLARAATLNKLVHVQCSNDFQKEWQRFISYFSLWASGKSAIEETKDAISFLACRGLFTDPVEGPADQMSDSYLFPLPEEWDWSTLGRLASTITSGSRGWKRFMGTQGALFIRSQDIKQNVLRPEDPVYVQLPGEIEGTRTLVQPGDLLMTITGANVGKCAQMPLLSQKAYVSQHVALIRLKDKRHAPFLHWWVTNSFGGQNYLSRFVYGDKPGLNLKQVGSIPVPLPPQHVQDQIVNKLGRFSDVFNRLSRKTEDTRNISMLLATAVVESVTGIRNEEYANMKTPKTELISNLNIGKIPLVMEETTLAAILLQNDGVMPAKTLWSVSKLDIDSFYQKLKVEMAKGWIIQSEIAYVKEEVS